MKSGAMQLLRQAAGSGISSKIGVPTIPAAKALPNTQSVRPQPSFTPGVTVEPLNANVQPIENATLSSLPQPVPVTSPPKTPATLQPGQASKAERRQYMLHGDRNEPPKKLAGNKTEVAHMLGIHPRTLTREAQRHPNFPRPLRVGKKKELYVIDEVLNFYRTAPRH